jgi:hypothetical protein
MSAMAAPRKALEPGHRRKFLVVIDETPECARAVQFASRRAEHTGGALLLLYVIAPAAFQQWKGVENIMRAEAMERAEAALGRFADMVRKWSSVEPQQVIREGETAARSRPHRDDETLPCSSLPPACKEDRPWSPPRRPRLRHVPGADHGGPGRPRRSGHRHSFVTGAALKGPGRGASLFERF